MYIPGTTYLHILLHCTLYLIAHLTPYFISLFVSYFILTIFIYILSRVLFHSFYCFYVIFILLLFFIFLHFPLSGPVLTNISLLIIPCMIVYVTNNKEPWTLNLDRVFSRGRWETPDPTMQKSWRPLLKQPGLSYHLSSVTDWSPPCHAALMQ